jgi:hypothetical protein
MANTPKLPVCRLTGTDGNVFAIIGNVAKVLERAGQREKASEFKKRAFSSHSINLDIANELAKCSVADKYGWEDARDVIAENSEVGASLCFDSDHMEHMDFVWQKPIQKILKKHKVKGDICFSSDDGDNRGQSWGYRFDGKGGMVALKGARTFEPVKPSKKTRKAR